MKGVDAMDEGDLRSWGQFHGTVFEATIRTMSPDRIVATEVSRTISIQARPSRIASEKIVIKICWKRSGHIALAFSK